MLPNLIANVAFKPREFLDRIIARVRTSDFISSVIEMKINTKHLNPQLEISAKENGEILSPSHLRNFLGWIDH